jgi:hypothetical protein
VKRSAIGPGKKALARGTTFKARQQPIARRTALKRRPISPASKAQRAKVKGARCVHCKLPARDPMHLCPRSRGGCDDPLCVVPGCRRCHRLFDEGKLDLMRDLVRGFRAELAHAQLHMSPIALVERLTGCRVVLRPKR